MFKLTTVGAGTTEVGTYIRAHTYMRALHMLAFAFAYIYHASREKYGAQLIIMGFLVPENDLP
jgi:hypothetical protein